MVRDIIYLLYWDIKWEIKYLIVKNNRALWWRVSYQVFSHWKFQRCKVTNLYKILVFKQDHCNLLDKQTITFNFFMELGSKRIKPNNRGLSCYCTAKLFRTHVYKLWQKMCPAHVTNTCRCDDSYQSKWEGVQYLHTNNHGNSSAADILLSSTIDQSKLR